MVPSLNENNKKLSYGEIKKNQSTDRNQLSPWTRLPVPMQVYDSDRHNISDYYNCTTSITPTASTAAVPTATTSFSESSTQVSSPAGRKYLQQRPTSSRQSSLGSGHSLSAAAGASGIKSPPLNRFLKRSAVKQHSLPQSIFRRQCAIDVPTAPQRSSLAANPTIILSPNNSFESTALSSGSQPAPINPALPSAAAATTQAQKLRKEWSQRQGTSTSVNSSLQSNGDLRSHKGSYFKGSRKSSLFDIRDAARRKFSLIPAVSSDCIKNVLEQFSKNFNRSRTVQFVCCYRKYVSEILSIVSTNGK